MKKNKKGFTLVELLVVIAILAILATVSIIGYTSFIERANQSNALTEAKQAYDICLALDVEDGYINGKAKDTKLNLTCVEEHEHTDACYETVNKTVKEAFEANTEYAALGTVTWAGTGAGYGFSLTCDNYNYKCTFDGTNWTVESR